MIKNLLKNPFNLSNNDYNNPLNLLRTLYYTPVYNIYKPLDNNKIEYNNPVRNPKPTTDNYNQTKYRIKGFENVNLSNDFLSLYAKNHPEDMVDIEQYQKRINYEPNENVYTDPLAGLYTTYSKTGEEPTEVEQQNEEIKNDNTHKKYIIKSNNKIGSKKIYAKLASLIGDRIHNYYFTTSEDNKLSFRDKNLNSRVDFYFNKDGNLMYDSYWNGIKQDRNSNKNYYPSYKISNLLKTAGYKIDSGEIPLRHNFKIKLKNNKILDGIYVSTDDNDGHMYRLINGTGYMIIYPTGIVKLFNKNNKFIQQFTINF